VHVGGTCASTQRQRSVQDPLNRLGFDPVENMPGLEEFKSQLADRKVG
jgi:hypothetical protein